MALTDNLVFYYQMEDDAASTTVVDSLAAHNGTASTNTSNLSDVGKINDGFDFDGSTEYVNSGYGEVISSDSFSCWFKKHNSSYPSSGDRNIFSIQGGTGIFKVMFHSSHQDKITFLYQKNGSNYVLKYGSTTIDQNWHHLVATVNGTTVTIYLDGSVETMNAWGSAGTCDSATTGSTIYIAMNAVDGTSTCFDGNIDEFGFWNKVLDSTEVTSLYNGGSGLTYPFSSGPDYSTIQINIGDVWKDCSGMQINIGDDWKEVIGMQINIGDAWKDVF